MCKSCSWALWRWGSGLLVSCVYKEKEKAKIMSQIVMFSPWLKVTLTMKKPSWLGSSSSASQCRSRCVFSLSQHPESARFFYSYWCKAKDLQWLQLLLFRDIINQNKNSTLLNPAPEVIGCSKAWISWVPLTIFPVSVWEQWDICLSPYLAVNYIAINGYKCIDKTPYAVTWVGSRP